MKNKEQIERLEQQVKDLQTFITTTLLKDMYKKTIEEPQGDWGPKVGDRYYSIDGGGNSFVSTWAGHIVDKDRLACGNIYKTVQEAKNAIRKKKILHKLEVAAKGWEPNWGAAGEAKWYIAYNHSVDIFVMVTNYYHQSANQHYFPTEQQAKDAIKTIGEEDLKFLWGVE